MKKEGYTPEIVWAMLADVAERQKETDRIMKEAGLKIDRLTESHEATERNIGSLTEKQAETSRNIDKLTANVSNLNTDVGGMQNSTGDFAEEYFFNSFKKGNRTYFGETFDRIKKNVPGGKPRTEFHDEYDIVLYNGKTIGIIETKFKARKFHVDDTIDKVKTFRANFPDYAGHQFYLALAAMSFEKGVEKKCKDKGIAIVKQDGDMVVICDDKMIAY
jgi:hypothetical protein